MTLARVFEQAPAAWSVPAIADDCWGDADTEVLVCRQVIDETADVKTFVFVAENGLPFAFEAGQFLTLELEIDGARIERCYSVSSPPTRPFALTITVKRIPGGLVSNWLHDNLHPGAKVRAKAPLGAFTLPADRERFVLVSAGSGITPMMSIVRALKDLAVHADVVFVHFARHPGDILFQTELQALALSMPTLRVVHVCTGSTAALVPWAGVRGRVSAPMLEVLVPDLAERTVLTCGPAGFMAAVRASLESLSYTMADYHEESYDFGVLTAVGAGEVQEPPPVDDSEAPTEFSIVFERSGIAVSCAPEQTILEAANAAGLRPPSTCGQGMCGTCKSDLLEGTVDMQHNGGIRPKEVALGRILICCSKPTSDVRVNV